ncbi:MAG: PKD domain-containing protein [Owenweeksia sp.]|nr:PKD domain-containing protein [Owenweeksia sp.]
MTVLARRPFIGSYSGSSTPNNGLPIKASSGAITVQFAPTYGATYAGFTLSWSTTATGVPNATFAVGNTSPAFNTPVQFVNTTSGGGSFLWEFGDGQTSTEASPQHRYTTTGPKQVRLIATNCFGKRTSAYTTVTVQSAPNGNISIDTLSMSIPCGTSSSSTFDISNSGSGNLSYNMALNQTNANTVVDEDFEDNSTAAIANHNSRG